MGFKQRNRTLPRKGSIGSAEDLHNLASSPSRESPLSSSPSRDTAHPSLSSSPVRELPITPIRSSLESLHEYVFSQSLVIMQN